MIPEDSPDIRPDDPARFLNRELSWLAFNRRVIEEAENTRHPLFERVRFLSIAAGNLDEFYMVRYAGLKAQLRARVTHKSADGLTPRQQIEAINLEAGGMMARLRTCWRALKIRLREEGVEILAPDRLPGKDREWLAERFERDVFPVLTPIAVDPAHPFPFIPGKALTIALELEEKSGEGKLLEALILLPPQLGRFVRLPGETPRYVTLENAVIMHLDRLFHSRFSVRSHTVFRVLRDSEIEIEEEAEDLVSTFETALKQRRRGHVIRMDIRENVSDSLLFFLGSHLDAEKEDTFHAEGLIGLADVAGIIDPERGDLLFAPYEPRFPGRIRDFGGDCFAAIRHKDILVHHPYESFDVVVRFLDQAAHDPAVVSIKQTLYRTSDNSPIVSALIAAAESGKTVTALVELKARFDEEANIRWARDMERAGVQVVYGFVDLKTHAKLSLIVRREDQGMRAYAHFGTGNYHPHTAEIYTDLSCFTCDAELCREAALMFNYMTGYAEPAALSYLGIAPINLRGTLTRLVREEIGHARAGRPAQIWAKCNALLDEEIIDLFYEASCAGVETDLVVRGICALRPGVPGLSENIRVKSIVGRYLEHARIYCFGNGRELPSREARVYISSADLMQRNLDRRIEALVPVTNETVHAQILDQIMVANLRDTAQSWIMTPDGNYRRVTGEAQSFCAQDYFMTNPSLSGRGRAAARETDAQHDD